LVPISLRKLITSQLYDSNQLYIAIKTLICLEAYTCYTTREIIEKTKNAFGPSLSLISTGLPMRSLPTCWLLRLVS
jgi:hypothetical protein